MENVIIEKGTSGRTLRRRPGRDEDREMEECIAKLKVWQTENLMAPHGMDRFAEKKKRTLRASAEARK